MQQINQNSSLKRCNGWKAREKSRGEPKHNWFNEPDWPRKQQLRSDWLKSATGEPIIIGPETSAPSCLGIRAVFSDNNKPSLTFQTKEEL